MNQLKNKFHFLFTFKNTRKRKLMPAKRFKIEKVPLAYAPVDHKPVFSGFPILYLELIENKEKVIPSLKNKPENPIFLPNVQNEVIQQLHSYAPIDDNKEFFNERDIRHKLNDRMKRSTDVKQHEDRDRKSARERLDENHRDELRAKELNAARKKESRSLPKNDQVSQPSHPPQVQLPPPPPIPLSQPLPPTIPQTQEDSIRSMLGGTSAPTIAIASATLPQLPPTLSEINNQANLNAPIKNISYVDTGDEVKRKRELLFRFDILKKSYKEANIPEFSEYTDIATMEQVYEDAVRKVGLDSKVEGYKKFLTMGFFGIEFLFSNIFKIDMSGFAKQQLSSMNSYDRILIELGEKAMIEKSKSQWPAEMRLLFTIVMNAVIFLLMKNVMSGGLTNIIGSIAGAATGAATGSSGGSDSGPMGMMSGLMNMMSGMGGGSSSASTAAPSQPKSGKKMKGPSVNMDDM
jgi:Family of unknown function (DUF5767)